MEVLLEGEAELITRKAIDMAKDGDTIALRMCMDRLLPVRKDRTVAFALPKLETSADAVQATAALVEAVAVGDLTPSEAAELSKLVEGFTRAVDLHDIQTRLASSNSSRRASGECSLVLKTPRPAGSHCGSAGAGLLPLHLRP
jgi:hypothetical protein